MRKLLHLLLLFLLTLPLAAQPYYVVSVKGAVTANGKQLAKKDKIPETAELRFGTPDAFAYVVSPGKGYFVLSPKKVRNRPENEFLLSLKEALLPPNEFNATSTRDARLVLPLSFSSEAALRQFFRGELLLIGGTRFEVSPGFLPLEAGRTLALLFPPSGTNTAKRYALPDSANTFVMDEALLSVANLPGRVSLVYELESTGEQQLLADFKLGILPRKGVIEELQQLYETITPIPLEVFLRDHAQPYLDKVYGDIQPEVVRQLVEGVFGKKK